MSNLTGQSVLAHTRRPRDRRGDYAKGQFTTTTQGAKEWEAACGCWAGHNRCSCCHLKLRPSLTQSVEEHQLIIDAIREGLPVKAHNHARAHRAHARDMLLPLLDRFGIKHL